MANPSKNDQSIRMQLARQGKIIPSAIQPPTKDKKASQAAAIASRKAEMQCKR